MGLGVLKDKAIMRMFLAIALPVALQNLLSFAVGLADTVMVGALGEAQLSGVSVANQPFFLYMMAIFGFGGGAGVLISQYWGKGDRETISKIFGLTIRVSIIVGVVAFLVVTLFPEQVMRLYTSELEVVPYGVDYLRVVAPSYLLFAFTAAYLNCVRSVERVKIAVIVYSISFVVDVFFNYMFIFGKFGAPKMGVAGAAVGTLIARAVELAIVLVYALKIETRVKLTLSGLLKTEKTLSRDFRKYATPVVFNEMMWALGSSATILVVGHMSVSALTTISVVNNVAQVMGVLLFGTGAATMVITGKYIGAREYALAKKNATGLVWLNVIVAVVCAVALIFLRPAFIALFSFSGSFTAATTAAINETLLFAAAIMVFQAINLSCIVGVFRGGGDTMFAMWVDVLGVWCMSVPLGALGALVLGLPIPLVFLLLRSDEVMKAVACLFRLHGGKWLRNVTRDESGRMERVT